jgi:hypothetical protein
MNQSINIRKETPLDYDRVIVLTEKALSDISGMVVLPPEFE